MCSVIRTTLAAIALTALAVPIVRADQSQTAAASIETVDPSLNRHQQELQPLMDLPPDEGFVTQLLMMRGHLRVGRALYEAGHRDIGAEHCSHPLKELYDDLAIQLADRDLPQFRAGLQALVEAAQQGLPAGDVAAAFDGAEAAIDATIDHIGSSKRMSAGFVARVAAGLVRVAQQEYEVSLADGQIRNEVEYQDSWAFYHEARTLIAGASEALAASDAAALAELNAQFEALALLWSSPDPAQQPVIDLALAIRTADRVDQLQQEFQ